MRTFCCDDLSPLCTGVTLVHGGSSVGVASLPSVLMEREFSEVKRGRPAVALDMVRVSQTTLRIMYYSCICVVLI